MQDQNVVIVVPFETEKQAKEVGEKLLREGWVFVVRVQMGVWQAWLENNGRMGESEVVTLRMRTVKSKVEKVYKKVKKIHPWPVFCFEVFEFEEARSAGES